MQQINRPDNLTERDIKVLMALEELPLGTFEEIAHLTGYPKSGVFNIYQRLSFHEEKEIPICAVCATPNIVTLGLEIADVLVDLSPSTPIEYLKEFCVEHPYTLYYAPVYGAFNGVFIQFRIPLGSRNQIHTIFQELRRLGKIENYTMFVFPWNPLYTTTRIGKSNRSYTRNDSEKEITFEKELTSEKELASEKEYAFEKEDIFESEKVTENDESSNQPDFSSEDPNEYYWNHAALKWDYDLLAWFQEVPEENIADYPQMFQISSNSPKSALQWLKKSDLYILVELMDNARNKNIDIVHLIEKKRKFEFTRQTYSRRLKRIEQECIIGHRVQIKARILDIHSPTLVIGEGSEEYIQRLAMHLQKNPIPFTSTFKHDKTTIFWYIHLPATHLADLLYSLRRNLTKLQVNVIDHPRSHGFYIYPDAFDENSKSWIQTEDFMVNHVLEYMNKWEFPDEQTKNF